VNLIVPVNLQALRVTPNDASAITKRIDFFAGPTTSFEQLPWRDAQWNEHAGRLSKANLSANIVNPLSGSVAEQLDAGIHLHWALPDGLTRGVQQPDGTLTFPAVPNRWLITRILQLSGQVVAKQWVVESDYLMTEAEYTGTSYPAPRRKAIAIPVGWNLIPGNNPTHDGGALYYPPSRRLGKVFELAAWQPTAPTPDAPLDQIRHLDELRQGANAFLSPGKAPGPLKAVGPSGAAFAAYYPDSKGIFGFHDTFSDLTGRFDLGSVSFQVSYQIVGWHSHASDDPLQTSAFVDAKSKASALNKNKPPASRLDDQHVFAAVVMDTYGWCYDLSAGMPSRCLYGGQLAGLPWDTTGNRPAINAKFPKCYLPPLADDPTVRVAVGNSAPGALAALVKQQWVEWAKAAWSPDAGQALDIPEQIEKDLEFLIDALQLGLLHQLGKSGSLPQLEQTLHQSGFGSRPGGRLWTIRLKPSASDRSDPARFSAPDVVLPEEAGALAGKLDALNGYQSRLDVLLNTIESCQRQIFLDWYHYVAAVYSGQGDDATNALKENLKNYIGSQVLDLWAKLEAAFGKQAAPSAATGNLPVFFSNASNYIAEQGGRYVTNSPAPSLAGQIVAGANDLLDQLAQATFAPVDKRAALAGKFELQRTEDARYWQPNEPMVVATGDGLRPARRNGAGKYLACRLSNNLLSELKATVSANQASLKGGDAAALFALAAPALSANQTPEGNDTKLLLDDVAALLGEGCLLDFSLASALAVKLTATGDATLAADLRSALLELAGRIRQAWQQGAPQNAVPPVPARLANQTIQANTLRVDMSGEAPQGLALTFQSGDAWQDPFLPLFLVWQADYRPFQKGVGADSSSYDPAYVVKQFQLDENSIELVFSTQVPQPQAGAATISGAIPLSSRASEPLVDQIQQYLAEFPEENPKLQTIVDQLRDKPLLSQGLSGVNPALVARAQGLQLTPFDPFYDSEAPVGILGAADDNLDYGNVLTHFVEWAAGILTDQVPSGTVGYSPLRSGFFNIARAHVVDAFGRKRLVVDARVPADAKKIVVSWQMQPPAGAGPIYLPPRLAQPARLQFQFLSAQDPDVVTNAHPATSPVCGWIVPNHLDNSLMLFAPGGRPLGSLGAFGAQTTVAWQSAPGNPARDMDLDLAGDDLAHLKKFADFVHDKDRATFFDPLMLAIEGAHTYILPDDAQAAQAQAVLMGRPLALVRTGLRLELAGLPAFDTSLDAVQAALPAKTDAPYDWTRRNDASLSGVDFLVRLGDRNHLEDGLVAFLLDGPNPYDTIYAPAAASTGGTGVTKPAPDTVRLKLRVNIDPPATPYLSAAQQIAALQDISAAPARLPVTLLMDPRASVHATTGILPVKAITLPAEIYTSALRAIEVAFFTHPVLRGTQGLELPVPDEGGFFWRWTTSVKLGGSVQPNDEDLLRLRMGDRAHFSFSPQLAQDGWLKLVPQPKESER
jgi:hypothetical protein